MARYESAKAIRNKLTAAVAAGTLLVPSAAMAEKASTEKITGARFGEVQKTLPGLYGEGSIAKRLVTKENCETGTGGSAEIKPAKNRPGTIRFELNYPATSDECIYPNGTESIIADDDQIGVRSLTAVVYKYTGKSDLYKEVTHVTVTGNGDGRDVTRRARVTMPNTDFCAEPDAKYALSLDSRIRTDEASNVWAQASFVEDAGSSLLTRDRAVHVPESHIADTFEPYCP